jgi:hypothetical protein
MHMWKYMEGTIENFVAHTKTGAWVARHVKHQSLICYIFEFLMTLLKTDKVQETRKHAGLLQFLLQLHVIFSNIYATQL